MDTSVFDQMKRTVKFGSLFHFVLGRTSSLRCLEHVRTMTATVGPHDARHIIERHASIQKTLGASRGHRHYGNILCGKASRRRGRVPDTGNVDLEFGSHRGLNLLPGLLYRSLKEPGLVYYQTISSCSRTGVLWIISMFLTFAGQELPRIYPFPAVHCTSLGMAARMPRLEQRLPRAVLNPFLLVVIPHYWTR